MERKQAGGMTSGGNAAFAGGGEPWIRRGAAAWGLMALVVAFAAGIIVGGTRSSRPGTDRHSTPETAAPRARVRVETDRAVLQDVASFLRAVGEVQSRTSISIASRIIARIVTVHVRAQDRVKRGDPLVTLDDADLRQQVQQAESAHRRGLADLDEARAEHARIRTLHEKHVESLQSLQRAERNFRSAEAEVERLRQAIGEAAVRLEFARIEGPIDGIVVDRRAEEGEVATPGRVLLEIHDPEALRFEAQLPESCYDRARRGLPVRIRLTGVTDPIETRIAELVPRVDPRTRKFPVRADLPAGLGISPGTFGFLQLPCQPAQVLVIPLSAWRQHGQLDLVFVADRGIARLRVVTVGRTSNELVQVLSGLSVGEEIVMAPPKGLRDGDPIVVGSAARASPDLEVRAESVTDRQVPAPGPDGPAAPEGDRP